MIYVIKKDGTREEFDPQKIVKAVNKSAARILYTFSDEEKEFICQFAQEHADSLGKNEIEIQALNLAMETIGTLSGDIYRESGRKIRIRASRILRELTDGKFIEVFRDNQQHIMLDTEQGQAELGKFSLADMKLVYFAIRMAAGELLAAKTTLPVMLDDLWSGCPEEQILSALKWLKKQPGQIFIRTDNAKITELLEHIEYTKM